MMLFANTTSTSSVDLTRVRFGAPSTVTGVHGGIERIEEDLRVQYTATRSRQEHLPNLNSLMGTDVGALTVTDVDFSTCRFKGAINLDKLGMGGTTRFARPRTVRSPDGICAAAG